MTITNRAIGTAVNSAGATTLGPVVPATAQVGDLLVLSITVNTAVAQTFTGLSSWTQQKNLSVNAPVLAVYTKVCVSADIGATLAPAWGTSAACSAVVVVWSGVDAAVATVDASGSSSNTASATVNYGSLTAPLNDTIVAVGAVTTAVAVGTPASYTNRVSNTTSIGLAVHERSVTAGATGSVTSASGGTPNSQGTLLALRPAQVPTFRAIGAGSGTASGTSVTPAPPATAQIGDLLIAVCSSTTTTTVWNTTAGWTLAGSQGNGSAIFYRFAAVAGAGTHTFTISTAASGISVDIVAYSGVGAVDTPASSSFAATTSIIFPTATSAGADRTLVMAAGMTGNPTTTPPAGMIEELDQVVVAAGRHYIVDETTPTSGTATGTRTMTASASQSGVAVSLLLAPPTNRPKIRGVAKNQTAGATSLSVTLPTTETVSDLLVMTIAWATNPGTITGPAGWNEVESDIAGTNGQWFKAYTKTAAGSDAAPSASWVNSVAASAQAIVMAGAGSVDIDGHTITAASATVTWPSVTTVGTADLLLFIGHSDGTTGLTPPAGSTLVLSEATTATAALAYETVNGAVATGSRTGTFGVADNTGYTLAIAGNTTPNAPTLTAPTNAATVDLAAGYTFTWTFSDPDAGDTQSAYYLRRKVAGAGAYEYWNSGTGVFQGSEVKNSTSTQSVTFAASKWTSGSIYNWSVATEDSFGAKGAYATDFTVTAGTAPTVTVTAPSGTYTQSSTPTVTWTYSDAEGDSQQTYQVKVESGAYGSSPGSGTAVYDSTELAGTATRSLVLPSLTNTTTYRVFVRSSQSGSQYSAWAFSTFTLSLDTPAQPTLTATADNANARVSLAVQGRDNLLESNTASIETDATGWAVDTNCTLARSTTDAVNGTASLQLTSAAAGAMRARTTTRYAITVGQTYTAVASFKTAVSARSVRVLIRWYTAIVAGSLVSTTTGASVTDGTGGYTLASATAAAPATATHAEVVLEVLATAAASEVHRADAIDIGPGSSTVWTRGGLAGVATALIEYSDDAGTTWATVRGASALAFDSAANQQVTTYDYESPPNTSRSYRATVQAVV